MEKFTPEQAEQICREARATISRPALHSECEGGERRERADEPPPVDRLPPECLPRETFAPAESRMDRDRREISECDQLWSRERRSQRRDEQSLEHRIDQKIASLRAELDELRTTMTEITRSMTKALQHLDQRAAPTTAVTAQIDRLFERLERRLDEALPHRGAVIDMPNPLRNVN